MNTDTPSLARAAGEALQAGDRAGFLRVVHALIAARAPMTSGWKSLATPLIDFGELSLARQAIDLFVERSGSAPTARFEQALVYVRSGRAAQAQAILRTIDPAVPDRAGNAFLRGTIALNTGARDEARASLLEAQAALPRSGQIWQALSMIGSLADDAALAEHVLAAQGDMAEAGTADRAGYLYALGKTHDDRGETDAAFAAFSRGAALVARERAYDPAADRRSADTALRGWTRDTLAQASAQPGAATGRPILVTGLPRSGSTLVEQVLASHSAVSGGDELGKFGVVVDEVGGTDQPSFTRWAQRHPPREASDLYLHLIDERFGSAGRVVDKTLEASRYLGLLAAVMPEAPIVWMRRDPLDNAWSCFHTWFLSGLAWSWQQEALAQHMRLEDELFSRWQDVLGDRLLAVDYQRLVSDKQTVIPEVLAHCGLAVEPQVFTPEKTERLVTTASVTQVRAPIHTRAVGAGHRYARHLQPFIAAYGYRG